MPLEAAGVMETAGVAESPSDAEPEGLVPAACAIPEPAAEPSEQVHALRGRAYCTSTMHVACCLSVFVQGITDAKCLFRTP